MFGPLRVYVATDDAIDSADSAAAQVLYHVKQALVRRSQFDALSTVEQLSFVTEWRRDDEGDLSATPGVSAKPQAAKAPAPYTQRTYVNNPSPYPTIDQ